MNGVVWFFYQGFQEYFDQAKRKLEFVYESNEVLKERKSVLEEGFTFGFELETFQTTFQSNMLDWWGDGRVYIRKIFLIFVLSFEFLLSYYKI